MPARSLFVMHLALQGCMRARDPEYGLTTDTGGHIRYVLDQVRALSARPDVDRVEVVTRGFRSATLGADYAVRDERIDDKSRLVRLFTRDPGYLRKEALEPEHESFLAALLAHLDTLPRLPDLLHAHYADAGLIASRLKTLLGIPFLFTAHSLGRVKREHQRLAPEELAVLERRIGFEETAIADADAILASSRDERDRQLGLYRGCDPGRVHTLPPGCDGNGFAAPFCPPAIAAGLDRFLREPGRPVVLAIARPVRRKNLLGLVDAFGRSAALREAANLVLVAGTRDDLSTGSGEAAEELRSILVAIDRHDLYGRVAYPKQHSPAEIPGYYAFARERGGVFVNPAFNEPYGLTLLEAAA
ncbi:MAG: glycosyltransferase, partial [Gluconacetobacter diazotrophicus]|nr:glycosyltransferase [Gluconacetobacter diazotrophicus]